MRRCPSCSAQASDDARFCVACGSALPHQGTETSGQTSPQFPVPSGMRGIDESSVSRVDGDEPTDPTLPIGRDKGDLVTCPQCGAPNVPKRRRCGKCGADLISGEMPVGQKRPVSVSARRRVNPPVRTSPRLEDIASEDSTELEASGRSSRPWGAIAAVATGVVLGIGVGGAAVAGVGPFDRSAPPTFSFSETTYDGPESPLVPAQVGATSVQSGDADTTHGPERLADADRSTAWRSLPDPDDDLFLDFRFDQPVWVTTIELAVGDQSDASAFGQYGRATLVRLEFDGTRTLTAQLQDQAGVQRIRLDRPRLTGLVRIHLEDFAGPDEAGVSMAEVAFSGHAANAADQARWEAAYGG